MKSIYIKITSLTILCVCVFLSGCINNSGIESMEEKQSEIPSTEIDFTLSQTANSEETVTETVIATDYYNEILEEYADMVQNAFYTDVLDSGDLDAYDASFGADIGMEIRTRVQNVYYTLLDIDQNGVQELVIAASDTDIVNSGDSPWYYDIYTYDRTKVVHLFPDYEFGYRTNFKLLKNGIIEVDGSYSAAESGSEFYRIGNDGVLPELVESFSMVGSMENDVVTFVYYQNANEITEQEYQDGIATYGEEITTSLEWIQIQ